MVHMTSGQVRGWMKISVSWPMNFRNVLRAVSVWKHVRMLMIKVNSWGRLSSLRYDLKMPTQPAKCTAMNGVMDLWKMAVCRDAVIHETECRVVPKAFRSAHPLPHSTGRQPCTPVNAALEVITI